MTPPDRAKILAELAAEEAAEAALSKRYALLSGALFIVVFTGILGGGVWIYYTPRPVSKEFIVIMMMLGSLLQVGQTLIGIWYRYAYTEKPDLRAILKNEVPSFCFGASMIFMPFAFFWPWMWIVAGSAFLAGIATSAIRRRARARERATRRAARDRSRNKLLS